MNIKDLIADVENIREKYPLLPRYLSVSLDIYEQLEFTVSISPAYLISGIYLSGLPVKLSKYLPTGTWVEHFGDFYIVHRPDCTFRV